MKNMSTNEIITDGIKSKSRVRDHGEVFTPANIVNDMMDLLKEEGYRLDATFLEPACGNGNFLVEILKRKMETANKMYTESSNNIEVYNLALAIAMSCIYGIDIQDDNIEEAKTRLRSGTPGSDVHIGYLAQYLKDTGEEMPKWLDKTLTYIMDRNIQVGNTLTNEKLAYGNKKGELEFIEWNFEGDEVQRIDYDARDISCPLSHRKYEKVNYKKLYRLKDIDKESEEDIDI